MGLGSWLPSGAVITTLPSPEFAVKILQLLGLTVMPKGPLSNPFAVTSKPICFMDGCN